MTNVNLESLVVNQHGAVKLLDSYEIFYGNTAEKIWGELDQYSNEGIAAFKSFCAEKGVSYYAAPNEDFFEFMGYDLAEKEGNSYLIMDNMS
jgi:hypothetical protein